MAGKRREKKSASSSKKIIAYAAIGILALAAVSAAVFSARPTPVDQAEEARQQAIKQFQERFCGLASEPRSTTYLTEFNLPSTCEMPLAIEAAGDRVWYVSTKNGTLGSYNVAEGKFGKEYQVPSWPTRTLPTAFSMSWSAKADNNGNIWFTDERQGAIWKFNEADESFSMFPVAAKLPITIDFDSAGRIYFAGVQSTSIFIGDPSKMKEGTTDGITEVKLPLDGFGPEISRVNTGSLAVDEENSKLWISLLSFQNKGQLIRYDINSGKVEQVLDLPSDITSPVGLTIDKSGNIWGTDHGTNIFFKYDQTTGAITKFATSVADSRIYAGLDQPNAYTLPYWIEQAQDTSLLWFNQHTGNKIASFDPEKLVLTEYWVPSQNRNWALCPEGADPCGLSNALQFSTTVGGQTWFTEWTENKLGVVDGAKMIPVSVSVQQQEQTVRRGDSIEIKLSLDATSNFDGSLISSSTLTANGRLGNSTGIFSEGSVNLQSGDSKEISFTFTPSTDVKPGMYTVMVGAANDEISVLKAVFVNVV